LDMFGNVDSKYRYVILAAKRAKQLLKGAKPKIKVKSRNLIRIAQTEVKSGLIEYEIIPAGKDEIPEQDERMFVGADIVADDVGEPEATGKDLEEAEPGKEAEEDVEEEGEDEEESDEELKEEKDE
jgi:DNA-directed RNA polymerase subunit omega